MIAVINASPIIDDLKKTQNIALNIAEFLDKIADRNNPDISVINVSIENKLRARGLLESKGTKNNEKISEDIFAKLDIPKGYINKEPTDLEKDRFMANRFIRISELLNELCLQLEKEDNNFQIEIEKVDARTVTYEFYKNGDQVGALKLFLGNCFGGKDSNIGISCDKHSFGSNGAFHDAFSSKVENGQL